MIRSVVLVTFKPGTTPEQVGEIERAMKAIPFEGCSRWELARDLGLREGNATHAFIADFTDEASYRAYDGDPEHNRVRRELVAPVAQRIERFQYRVD